jgi:hypothetical protein
MSAHDTVLGHAFSTAALIWSMISNPCNRLLIVAALSLFGPAKSTDPSHPCTYPSTLLAIQNKVCISGRDVKI